MDRAVDNGIDQLDNINFVATVYAFLDILTAYFIPFMVKWSRQLSSGMLKHQRLALQANRYCHSFLYVHMWHIRVLMCSSVHFFHFKRFEHILELLVRRLSVVFNTLGHQ